MKKWTFLIYFSGDNNLSVDMAYTIEQMRRVSASNPDVNLLVYFDGYSPEIPTLYADFSNSYHEQIFRRSHTIENKLFDVKDEHNENSASMYSLINFVHWGVNQVEYSENGNVFKGRKADNYGIIFSGHSMGFQSIGLFQDSKANYSMTMPKLRWALDRIRAKETTLKAWAEEDEARDIKWQRERAEKENRQISEDELGWTDEKRTSRTTVVLGRNPALIGFDSCMMGMLEVASQFAGMAETMVASEGSIPNAGWSYAQMLFAEANQNAASPASDLARTFVEKYIKQQNQHAIGGVSVDISAWDLSKDKIDAINERFEEFAAALTKCFEQKDANYGQMKRALLSARFHCQSYAGEQNVDLVDLCELLIAEIDAIGNEVGTDGIADVRDVAAKAGNLISAIRECIILSGFSGGKNQFSNGVSIYFPWTKDGYCASLKDYLRLEFVDRSTADVIAYSKWKTFLEKYLGEVTFRNPRPLGPSAHSRVFESYRYKDAEAKPDSDCIRAGNLQHEQRRPPYGDINDRRPPYGDPNDRRPPYGDLNDRRPPYGSITDRGLGDLLRGMSGAMGQFFEQYARIKNFGGPWNLAGFTSSNVEFVSRHVPNQSRTTTDQMRLKPIVVIESGNEIHRKIDDYLQRYNLADRDQIAAILDGIAELGDETKLVDFLDRLQLETSNQTVSIVDAIRASSLKISDASIQQKINEKMNF